MILVTGGTGLVGAHLLLQLLEKQQGVRAIYRTALAKNKTKFVFEQANKLEWFSRIEWVQADLTNLPQLEIAFLEVQHVYHCAGLISFDPADEELLRKTNIEGTANIVNLCLAHGIQKLCFMSSIATIGMAPISTLPNDESHEWNPELPHTDYAISKYGAEMEIWRGFQEGLPMAIVNPGVILGPYFWDSGSGQLFSKVAKKFPFYTLGATGFVGIQDVVNALIMLMESEIAGERFILVADNLTYKNMLQIIANEMNKSVRWMQINNWQLAIAWRMDALASRILGKKRTLSKQFAHSLCKTSVYSSDKIKRNFNFCFTPLPEQIRAIAQAFLRHN